MDDIIKALAGEKINRKRIYIARDVIEKLKTLKKKIRGSLEVCEMVETCFDRFNFTGEFKEEKRENTLDKFSEKKVEYVQVYIREDIIKKLMEIKNISGVPANEIITKIILFQISEANKLLF